MSKQKYLSALLTAFTMFNIIPINISALDDVEMTYNVAEEEGSAMFHLDTLTIEYNKTNLSQPINYHITTNAGNYYAENELARNTPYFVEADKVVLRDERGSSTVLAVTLDYSDDKGTLDLTRTVTDNTTYAGSIETTVEEAVKAGSYYGTTIIRFNEHALSNICGITGEGSIYADALIPNDSNHDYAAWDENDTTFHYDVTDDGVIKIYGEVTGNPDSYVPYYLQFRAPQAGYELSCFEGGTLTIYKEETTSNSHTTWGDDYKVSEVISNKSKLPGAVAYIGVTDSISLDPNVESITRFTIDWGDGNAKVYTVDASGIVLK